MKRQEFAALRLTATAEKARIVPGEPLSLRVTAANPGAQPVRAHRDLSPDYGLLEVRVERPGGAPRRIQGPGWGTSGARPRPADLAPGETLVGEVTLFAPAFDRPGTYRIAVRWHQLGFAQNVVAPVVTIEVVAPQGEDRRLSDALGSDPELAGFLSGATPGSGALVARVEGWIAQNAVSILAAHLRLALRRHFVRTREPERALAVLRLALLAPARSAVRRAAVLTLAQTLARTGALGPAQEVLTGAVADFRDSADQPRFERMRQELAKAGKK